MLSSNGNSSSSSSGIGGGDPNGGPASCSGLPIDSSESNFVKNVQHAVSLSCREVIAITYVFNIKYFAEFIKLPCGG
jgi:hypothetical protein